MMDLINQRLQKMMPVITPTSVVLGVFFAAYLEPVSYLVPWLFAFMTFSGSLGSGIGHLLRSVARPMQMLTTLVVLHVIIPLFAFGVGHLFFHGDDYLITGLVLAVVIPTGITSLIWVAIHRGDVPLTLSVILTDTLLSPYIVPSSLAFLIGAKVNVDAWAMSKGLIWMVVIPSLLGIALFHLTKGKVKAALAPKLAPVTKICLGVVVAMNSSVVAPYLFPLSWKLASIGAVVFFIASSGYLCGWLIAKWCGWNRDVIVSMTFNGGMRNISAGAVLAMAYFPPPVLIPVILGMLFQQMLASIYGSLLSRYLSVDKKQIAVLAKTGGNNISGSS